MRKINANRKIWERVNFTRKVYFLSED
jgi:hypothetical protein